jgi:hypothetical protein
VAGVCACQCRLPAQVDAHSETLSVTTFDPAREADSAGTYVYKVAQQARLRMRSRHALC